LETFWAGATLIFADIDSPIALAFLDSYPTPASAARLGVSVCSLSDGRECAVFGGGGAAWEGSRVALPFGVVGNGAGFVAAARPLPAPSPRAAP
jgi:hypothetical protein